MTNTITIDARAFRVLVAPVLPWAGADNRLPLLAAVRIERRGPWLVAAATDRYRLAMKRVRLGDADDQATDFAAVVRTSDLRRVLQLWKPTRNANPLMRLSIDGTTQTGGTQRLYVESAGAMVDFDEARVAFRTFDVGDYPRIDRLLVDALRRSTVADRATALNPTFLADLVDAQEHGEPAVMWGGWANEDLLRPTPVAVTVGEDFAAAIVQVRNASTAAGQTPDVSSWLDLLAGPTEAPKTAAVA